MSTSHPREMEREIISDYGSIHPIIAKKTGSISRLGLFYACFIPSLSHEGNKRRYGKEKQNHNIW
jgi:hypothetical protein